jgi:hypothetical protein
LRTFDLLHVVDGGQFLQAIEGDASRSDFIVLDGMLDQGALLETGIGQVLQVAREVHDDVHGGTGQGSFDGGRQLSGFVPAREQADAQIRIQFLQHWSPLT